MMKLKLDEILVGKKMEPRYLEYNWRDVVLYALAVGAKRDDLMYTYEKYLKAIPTYGTSAVLGDGQRPAVSVDASAGVYAGQ